MTRPLRELFRLTSVLALAALAAPAVASATHWDFERQPIPQGQILEIASSGPLKLRLKQPGKPGISFACTASGVEAVWNTSTNGLDETKSIHFSCTAECGQATVSPVLPWTSLLEGSSQPPLDRWEGVRLRVSCGGVRYGTFAGTLIPTMGDGDPQGPGHPDDLDDELRFTAAGPDLLGPNGSSLAVNGFYKLGSKGHGVTGEL